MRFVLAEVGLGLQWEACLPGLASRPVANVGRPRLMEAVGGHRFSGQSWPAKVGGHGGIDGQSWPAKVGGHGIGRWPKLAGQGGGRPPCEVGLRALPRQVACTADLVPVAAAHYRGGQAF